MPRRARPGTIYAEQHLAERIAYERRRRGWSLDGLAKRMAEAGRPMAKTPLQRTEEGARGIKVDELVAFSQVFGIPIGNLLLPPEAAASRELERLLAGYEKTLGRLNHAQAEAFEALARLHAFLSEHPAQFQSIRDLADSYQQDPQGAHTFTAATLVAEIEDMEAEAGMTRDWERFTGEVEHDEHREA